MCAHVSKHILVHMCAHSQRQLRVQVLPPMGKKNITFFPRLWMGGAPEMQIWLGLAITQANSKLVCFPFWALRLQQLKNKVHKPLTSPPPTCSRGSHKERCFLPAFTILVWGRRGACLLNYILERGRRHSPLALPTSGGAGLWVESFVQVTLCKSPGTPYV